MRQLGLDQPSGLEHQVLKRRVGRLSAESVRRCVYCQGESFQELLDLGAQPLANSLLESPFEVETYYPLILVRCDDCDLVQRETRFELPIFDRDYPYRTSINTAYVKQCHEWADTQDWKGKRVLEIGCNDGYLLDYLEKKGAIAYGIDPSIDRKKPGWFQDFFSKSWVEDRCLVNSFDVIIANNVIAHTPHLQSFIEGIEQALKLDGKVFIEYPSFKHLCDRMAIDTIYHEHFSYFTHETLSDLMGRHGFVNTYSTFLESHGGSFRDCFEFDHGGHFQENLIVPTYDLKAPALARKHRLMRHLSHLSENFPDLVVFGAAAKGISMLNWLGIKSDMIKVCVDETPEKQWKWMPGSRIPIQPIEYLERARPSCIVILPWNFEKEIRQKLEFTSKWNARIEVLRHA